MSCQATGTKQRRALISFWLGCVNYYTEDHPDKLDGRPVTLFTFGAFETCCIRAETGDTRCVVCYEGSRLKGVVMTEVTYAAPKQSMPDIDPQKPYVCHKRTNDTTADVPPNPTECSLLLTLFRKPHRISQ